MEANPMLLRRDVSSSSRVVLVVMILLVVVNLSYCVISSDTSLMSVESQSNTSTSTNRNKMDKESLIGYDEEELEYQMDSEINRRILAGTNMYVTFMSNNFGPTSCGNKRSIGKSCVGPVNNQKTNCGKDVYNRAC